MAGLKGATVAAAIGKTKRGEAQVRSFERTCWGKSGLGDPWSPRAAKQLHDQTTQPPVSSFVMISGMPVLSDRKSIDGNRAGVHGQIVDLRQRLTNVPRQCGNQIRALDDRAKPKKPGQLQHHLALDVLAHQRLFK
jgi:hypothetical protein